MRTLKNHREQMSVRVNVRKSKIMRMPTKVDVRTYATYVNCQTLLLIGVVEMHHQEIAYKQLLLNDLDSFPTKCFQNDT